MRKSLSAALTAALVVVLAVLVPLSAVAVWADRVIGDRDRYVAAMAPLARDPAVQDAVVRQATRAISGQIDVGPFQAGLETLLAEAVRSFVGTDNFQTAWNTANRAAHEAFFEALSSGEGNTVSVDLAPVIEQVRADLIADGVPFADRIPVGHVAITVLEYENLGALRKGFHVLQVAGLWLPLLALVLVAGAVAGARRRLRVLVAVGTGLALGALLLAAAVPEGRRRTLRDLPPDVDRPAAAAVYDALTAFLRTSAWVVLAAGAVLALGAWAAGRIARRRAGGSGPGTPEAPHPDQTIRTTP
ncbi:hypothetical protein LG634_01035 [Streptomyces bambusae]|uniref:hypothetical protein n=1 Tax=Streptomyces bambusae TaxID=1550616 RepID=UPI001CFE2B74|nr:hypothetical protein [Streptomyces bambusae]MCB5163438.1 hypothetical protein [Streptomyces bambusae]